ncbi:MAG TPA: histidine kinase [Pseudonocardia sp.]
MDPPPRRHAPRPGPRAAWSARLAATWRDRPARVRDGLVAATLGGLLVASGLHGAPWYQLAPAAFGGLPVLAARTRPGLAVAACAVVACGYAAALGDMAPPWVVTVAVLFLAVAHGPDTVVPGVVGVAGGAIILASSVLAVRRYGGTWTDELVYVVVLPLLAVGWGAGTRELRLRNAELERLRAAELHAAVGEERRRIAGDLHDVVAHEVAAIVVRARTGQRPGATGGDAAAALASIAEMGTAALSSMREVVTVLRDPDRPGEVAPPPGLDAVPNLVAAARRAGLEVDLVAVPAPSPPGLPDDVALAAFRIVQESLSNVLQHAGATRAAVALRVGGGALVVTVDDDGRRARPDDPGHVDGHGLVGMRERAAAAGGTLELGTGPLGGWSVRAALPLRAGSREWCRGGGWAG